VGHSHVLPPKLRNNADARAVLIRLIHRAAARMRGMGYWARQMDVYVGFVARGKWKIQTHLGLCQDTLTMVEVFSELWKRLPSARPLQVGVTLFDLVADHNAARPLFEGEQKRIELSRTMDQLNTRFGAQTVYLGGMHHVNEAAPPRIAFNHIPQLRPAEM
jgi:DNA polymerase-4